MFYGFNIKSEYRLLIAATSSFHQTSFTATDRRIPAEGDAEGVIQYSLGRSPRNRRYGDSPALKARFKNGPISFESRLQPCNCDPPESWGFAPGYSE